MEFNIVRRMFCLIIFLCTLIGVWSQSPQNAVAVLNGQVTLNCAAGPSSDLNWILNANPRIGAGTPIARSCTIQSSFTANYAVESGSDFCNLIVNNVNMQLAGTYSCMNTVTSTLSRIVLTVIDPDANVSVLNSTALAEGDSVNISCSLEYNASALNLPQLIPTLSWKVPIGQIATTVINDTQTNSVSSVITVLLQRPNLPIFQCIVNFTIAGDISDRYATNIPSSPVASWNTSMIYGVLSRTCIIISETTANSGICRLSNLSCFASTNVPTSYSWVDVIDPQPWNSLNNQQFFPFAEDGRTYQCTPHYIIGVTKRSIQCTFEVPNQSQSTNPCRIAHENDMNIYSTDSNCNTEVRPVTCNCKNGIYPRLVCNATNVFPEPTYRWEDENGNFLGNDSSYQLTNLKGNIKCIALTAIPGVNASSSRIVSVTDCLGNDESQKDREEPNPTHSPCLIISMWVGVTVLAFQWHSC